MTVPKKIGFLSFGAWHPGGGLTHTAGDALRQTVELAVAAEEIGIDGAFVRVHHFARQLSSPFPLLAAIGVKTTPDRDRHRRDRHALREPALHGRDRGSGRPARRRPAPARRQPRLARAGLARRRGVRLLGRPRRGAREDGALPRGDRRRRRRPRRQRRPPRRGDAPCPAAVARPRRPDLVGLRLARDRRLGGRAGPEPDELHPPARGHAGAVRPSSRPSRSSCSARRGRRQATRGSLASRSAAASSRSPPTSTGDSSAPTRTRTRSAGSTARSAASAAATPASPTGSPTSSPTTPPFRRPTRSS